MTKTYLDEDSDSVRYILKSTAAASGTTDLEAIRAEMAVYAPRDTVEAHLAGQIVMMKHAIVQLTQIAREPHVEERDAARARRTAAGMERAIRSTEKRLAKLALRSDPEAAPPAPPPAPPVPLEQRMKLHLIEGNTSIH